MGKVRKSNKRRYDSEPPRANKRSKHKKVSYVFSEGSSDIYTDEIDLKKKVGKMKEEMHRRLIDMETQKRGVKVKKQQLKESEDKAYHVQEQISKKEEEVNQLREETIKLKNMEKTLLERKKKNAETFKKKYNSLVEQSKTVKQIIKTSIPKKQKTLPKSSRNEYDPKTLANSLKPCAVILQQIMQHQHAWVFMEPVDIQRYPDYAETVQRPMCLSNVQANLYQGIYTNIHQFGRDMKQIFLNCMSYNPKGHQFNKWAQLVSDKFENLYGRAIQGLDPKEETIKSKQAQLTPQELKEIQEKIQDLNPTQLSKLEELVGPYSASNNANEMSLDLDILPIHVLRELQEFVRKPRINKRAQRQRIKRELRDLETNPNTSLPPPSQRSGFGMPPPNF